MNRQARRAARAWFAVIPLAVACATATPTPAVAPRIVPPVLEFRLEWLGAADLDMYVGGPHGKKVWYGEPRSPSGGVLNVDCNVNPGDACTEPVETVKWPPGRAPPGIYQYWVRLMHPREAELPVVFQVTVLRDAQVLAQHHGEIDIPGDSSQKWLIVYPRNLGF